MKRFLAPTIAAALLATAAPAMAQYRDYDRYDRYDHYDRYDRYDTYDRAGPVYDHARVLSVDPIIDSVAQPIRRDECWREPMLVREPVRYDRYRYRDRGSAAPAVVGAIVGGVVGNQFGSGRGRDAMTLAGAALGYSAVRDAQRYDYRGRYYSQDRVYRTYAERCSVRTDWRRDDRVVAYNVTYDYNGQIYRTQTNYHPGDTIRVRVDVDALP